MRQISRPLSSRGRNGEIRTRGKVLAHERGRILRNLVRQPMIIDEPEPEVDGWNEAEAALAAAQHMPGGPARAAALKEAGQLRLKADERRLRKEQRDRDKLQ